MNHTVPRLGLLPMEVPSLHSVHPHMTMPGWVNLDMENLERAKKIQFGFFAKYLPKECREKKDIFTCGSSASPGLQAALHARGQALAAGQPADNFGHGSREQSKVTARDSFDRYREVSDDLFQ